jgi:hypothetical protein
MLDALGSGFLAEGRNTSQVAQEEIAICQDDKNPPRAPPAPVLG